MRPVRVKGVFLMRVLVVGAGGVGSAAAGIAARRSFFSAFVIADYSLDRASRAAAADPRFVAAQVDASSQSDISDLCRRFSITHVLNAVDPRFVLPIFQGALDA